MNRAPIATMIARRLRRLCGDGQSAARHEPGSFLIHLDGPWGVGKTSILNFLRDDLESGDDQWLVVDVNAWQQANLGPAWWMLLTSLRRRIGEQSRPLERMKLRIAEALRRGRVAGGPYLLAVTFAIALAAIVVLAVGPGS